MTRLEARLFHLVNVLVTVTGLAYAWTAYFATNDDPYALSHPLQAPFQHAHVLVAPFLIFAVGVMWRSHAAERVRSNASERKVSGWSLLITFVPAGLSGYVIQTASDETWRAVWVGVHLIASAAWVVGSLAHVLARYRRRRSARFAVTLEDQTVSMSSSTRG